MSRPVSTALLLMSTLFAGTSFAASSSTAPVAASTSTAPVAFVYVTSGYIAHGKIYGFAAAPDGRLTPTPYSPYLAEVVNLVANGKYLFASGNSGVPNIIYSYSIGPHGYLTQVATTDVGNFPVSGDPWATELILDHSGTSLYPFIYDYDTGNNAYMSLKVASTTGKLTFLSETPESGYYGTPLTFIGNNSLAYEGSCNEILGFRRESNGSLVKINVGTPFPTAPAGDTYCASNPSADPTNHLAIPVKTSGSQNSGEVQIASYTVDTYNGNLTTTSTYKNMPKVAVAGASASTGGVGDVTTTSMSPSGKLLAVGGSTGLQIFHFNGANPATVDTGALTTDAIYQVFWDKANHLYAVSTSANKLFVFTVTPTSAVQAPGSPYSIPNAGPLVVLPR